MFCRYKNKMIEFEVGSFFIEFVKIYLFTNGKNYRQKTSFCTIRKLNEPNGIIIVHRHFGYCRAILKSSIYLKWMSCTMNQSFDILILVKQNRKKIWSLRSLLQQVTLQKIEIQNFTTSITIWLIIKNIKEEAEKMFFFIYFHITAYVEFI